MTAAMKGHDTIPGVSVEISAGISAGNDERLAIRKLSQRAAYKSEQERVYPAIEQTYFA